MHRVKVEISVVLGRSSIPLHQLLKMGRGAVIPLDATEHEPVWILANNRPIARGEITVNNERLGVTVTEKADAYQFYATL